MNGNTQKNLSPMPIYRGQTTKTLQSALQQSGWIHASCFLITCISYKKGMGHWKKAGCQAVRVVFAWKILLEIPTVHSWLYPKIFYITAKLSKGMLYLKNPMPKLHSIMTCSQCDREETSQAIFSSSLVVWHQSYYVNLSVGRRGVLDHKDH